MFIIELCLCSALLMVLLLPVINLLGVVYFIGGDVKNVKMFYQNYEQNCMLIFNIMVVGIHS